MEWVERWIKMRKYAVIEKMEELPVIAEEYEKQLGIRLSEYKKYTSLQEQWEKVTENISNNCRYEDVHLKMYMIINEVMHGKYVNKKNKWKEMLVFFQEQIEKCTLYYNDIFLNAYFSIRYVENRKIENKHIGISSDYLSNKDFEIPIEEELTTAFCRKYKKYFFGTNRGSIFSVKRHFEEKEDSFTEWNYKTRNNSGSEIDNTRWSYEKIHQIEKKGKFEIEDTIFLYKTVNPILATCLWNNYILQDEYDVGNNVYQRISKIDKICNIESLGWQDILVQIVKGLEYLQSILFKEKQLELLFPTSKNETIFISKNKRIQSCREENLLCCEEQLMSLWDIITSKTKRINYLNDFYSKGLVYCCCQTTDGLGYLSEKCEQYIQSHTKVDDEDKSELKSNRMRWGRNGEPCEHLYAWIQSEVICTTMGHYKRKQCNVNKNT